MDRIARAISTAQFLAGSVRGLPTIPPEILAENVSLVLHEHSQSTAVQGTVRRIQRFNRRESRLRALPVVNLNDPLPESHVWLCPTLGISDRLEDIAEQHKRPPRIVRIDEPAENASYSTDFFRAIARLELPGRTPCNVLVVGLPARPGEKDAELVHDGPFSWPEQHENVVESLESLVLRFVEQWMPGMHLWGGSAERVLPDGEIEATPSTR